MRIFIATGKDLRRFLNDRRALVVSLALPLVLTFIMGLSFGGGLFGSQDFWKNRVMKMLKSTRTMAISENPTGANSTPSWSQPVPPNFPSSFLPSCVKAAAW
jgi:hypothetical protein